MQRVTICFCLKAEKRKALDALALALDRHRTYILNQAVDAYLDVHQWEMNHIQEGLRQAFLPAAPVRIR